MLHQKPLHSEKVTVWCGVSAFGVLGPYFFENATGQSVRYSSGTTVFKKRFHSKRSMLLRQTMHDD
jgi:hypothetical protein